MNQKPTQSESVGAGDQDTQDRLLDLFFIPSPPPTKERTREPDFASLWLGGETLGQLEARCECPFSLTSALILAGQGLNEAEIILKLNAPFPLPPVQQSALRTVIETGRTLGSADLKQEICRQAREGKVNAFKQLAENLGSESDFSEGPFTVIDEIIGEGEQEI